LLRHSVVPGRAVTVVVGDIDGDLTAETTDPRQALCDSVARDRDHHDIGPGGITTVPAECCHVMAGSCPSPR
jgi:hypothetical protein